MTGTVTSAAWEPVDFGLDETQSRYRELARRVALDRLAAGYQRRERTGFVEPDLMLEIGGLGLIAPETAEHLGGRGLDRLTTGIITEEIARGDINVGLLQVVGSLVAQILAENARTEIAAEWVPRICSGEHIVALGLSEPNAGSDAGMPAMRARRERGGYVLNGQKSMSFCMQASGAVVFARTSA